MYCRIISIFIWLCVMAEHPKQDKTPAEVEKSKVEDIKRLLIGHLESEPKIPQTIDFSHLRDILYDE